MIPMANTEQLPDFIVIGALKCATTWLDLQLRSHQDLSLPNNRKEVNFFSTEYDQGVDWYKSFWADPGNRRAELRLGEVSPTYFEHPAAPERIHQLLPDVKLVVLLREPVSRLYSHYTAWVQVTGYSAGFEAFVVEHRNAVETGFYDVHLNRYLDYFPREQLKVLILEEMLASPEAQLRMLRSYLGVAADGHWQVVDSGVVNKTVKPRMPRLFVAAHKAAGILRKQRFDWIVEIAKEMGVPKLVTGSQPFPKMSDESRKIFLCEYEAHVRGVEELLGRRIEAWEN